MNAQILCLALTMASETFAPLPEANLALACEQAGNLIEQAEEKGLDPTIMAGLVYVESRWTPTAVSRSGACGLTQVIPRYVDESCSDLKEPTTSIRVGSASLKKWTTMRVKRKGKLVRVPRTGGIKTALACYNAGNVCAGSSQGRAYARSVIRYANRIKELAAGVMEETNHYADQLLDSDNHGIPMLPFHFTSDGTAYYRPIYDQSKSL